MFMIILFFSTWQSVLDFICSRLTDIRVSGIDHHDYPDYCDAYISAADINGRPLNEGELELINENRQFVYEQVWKAIH